MTSGIMGQRFKTAVASLSCAVLTVGCTATGDTKTADNVAPSSSQQDLNTIMLWWNGSYNNDRHLAALAVQGKPIWRADGSGKGGHIEVTSHYRSIDLPEFGSHVIYVEETKHGEPDNIFRQRIYTLSIDERDQLRVKLWYFNDKKKYVGAWKNLSKLSDLTKDQMFPLQDECDLLVKKQGDKYHMPMADKACVFGDNYFSYQVLLGEQSFWFRDKINAVADDAVISMAGDYTYHELDKIN
ncbi:MAG: chromophore lyase CpcT/CpeT [Parasphingorhabdus sp.]|uniref:chromophore lyase CpcT/CpeT n=1 Tax=Parasphingorhabdus sp. TaxID=2709688 RepID=UPI003298A7D2